MKVMFIFGGVPHYHNYLLNQLNNFENIEVVVVIPGHGDKTLGKNVYQTLEGINFKVIQLEEHKTYYGKFFLKKFKSVLKKENPDIIVAGWPYILSFAFYPFLLLTCRQLGVKLINKEIPFLVPKFDQAKAYYMETIGYDEDMVPYKYTYLKGLFLTYTRKYFYSLMAAHVCYTEEGVEIIGSYGVDKKKIFVTYNSPDTDALLKIEEKIKLMGAVLSENKYRIVHVGRLVKWKRVDLLIEAISSLISKFPSIELLVIGSGPEKNNLKEMAANYHVESNVVFTEGIYDNEILGKYLKASSIYVLAGMGGLSVNEAMCFGKPIICSVCDGTEKKLVVNNYNGFYFKNGDVRDLASKIDILLSDTNLVKQFGENSRKIIEEQVNSQIVISRYLDAFNFVYDSNK